MLRLIAASLLTCCIASSALAQTKIPVGINLNDISCWERSPTFIDPMKSMKDWHLKNADWSGGYTSGCPLDSLEIDENGYPVEIPQTITGYAPQMVETMLPENHPAGQYVFTYDGEGTFRFHLGASVVSQEQGRWVIDYPGGGTSVAFVIESTPRGNHLRNFRMVPIEMEDTYDPAQPFLQSYIDVVSRFHCLRFMGWQGINGSDHMYWANRRTVDYYTQMASQDHGPALEYAIMLCNIARTDMWWCVPHKADDNFMVQAAQMIKERLDPQLKWYCEYSNETWNWAPYFTQFGWINGDNGVGACEGAADSLGDAILQLYQGGGDFGTANGYMANRLFTHVMSVFTGVDAERVVRVVGGHSGWFGISKSAVDYVMDHGNGCDAVAIAPYFGFEGGGSAVDYFCANPGQATPQAVVDSIGVAQQHTWNNAIEHGTYAKQQGIDLIYYEGGVSYGYTNCLFENGLNDIMQSSAYTDGMYDLTLADIQTAGGAQVDCKLYVPLILFGEPHHYGHLDSASQIYLSHDQWPAKFRALMDGNAEKTVAAAHHSDATRQPRASAAPEAHLSLGPRHRVVRKTGSDAGESLYGLDGRLVYDPSRHLAPMKSPLSAAVYIARPLQQDGHVEHE